MNASRTSQDAGGRTRDLNLDPSAQLLYNLGAFQARQQSNLLLQMRLAGLNSYCSEATRSGRALGQGPSASVTHPRKGPITPADSEEWTTIGQR